MPVLASTISENFVSASTLALGGGFMNPDIIVESFGLLSGMKVADFGSGSGYFTILIAKKIGENGVVTAVDIMENALETVRARASAGGLNNLQTIRADLEVLGGSGLADSSQDIVLLANILFQSSKRSEIVKEAKRVLLPGGALIFIDWKKGGGGLGPPEANRVDAQEIKSIFENEGLSFVREIDAGAFHYGLIYKK